MSATAGLLKKIFDLGCSIVTEEQLGMNHFRLTVDDEYVEAARRLVYESVPFILKVDVTGASEPRFVAIAPGDWSRFQKHYDNQTACEVGGRMWLVRSMEFEAGPAWRGQVGLIPLRNPITGEIVNRPDEPKPNHVRDAVLNNL